MAKLSSPFLRIFTLLLISYLNFFNDTFCHRNNHKQTSLKQNKNKSKSSTHNHPQQLNTPILFLIFRRPKIQESVFKQIRHVKPKQLFIACDGPRMHIPEEYEKCMAARKIVEKIDWPCEVKTLFLDKNLGCGRAVSGAITWFFKNVNEGIILEDDCVPHESFFYFCQEMLTKYADESKILGINGSFQAASHTNNTYYFTDLTHPWGWATWRRAWNHFDYEMKHLETLYSSKKLEKLFPTSKVTELKWHLDGARRGNNIWAIRWTYSVLYNDGLIINPTINLIYNIGFDQDSTHSTNPQDQLYQIPAQAIDWKHLVHPPLPSTRKIKKKLS